jgi:hypothetical protein
MAAYYLSIRDLGPFDGARVESPAALKQYMIELAHNRGGDSSLNLFYNGITPSDVRGTESDAPVSSTFVAGIVSVSCHCLKIEIQTNPNFLPLGLPN